MSTQKDNSKVVDFEAAKKELKNKTEDNVAELKAQIEQDEFLKYAIRIISNTAIDNDKLSEADLLEEYKSEALKRGDKFQSLGEVSDSQVGFYYQLFQLGYRTFGAEFFKQMCMNETNCVQMFIGLWSLVCGLESLSDTLAQKDVELAAYKALKLNPEQKEILAEGLNKTPQQLMEEMWTKALDLDGEEGDK